MCILAKSKFGVHLYIHTLVQTRVIFGLERVSVSPARLKYCDVYRALNCTMFNISINIYIFFLLRR